MADFATSFTKEVPIASGFYDTQRITPSTQTVNIKRKWLHLFSTCVRIYNDNSADLAIDEFEFNPLEQPLSGGAIKKKVPLLQDGDVTNMIVLGGAGDSAQDHLIVQALDKIGVKNLQTQLKTLQSGDVFVLSNVQVIRNKTNTLEQIPTYEIVTNVLNNQMETPIARMRTSAPTIGGPAIHEFPMGYLVLEGNTVRLYTDEKRKNLEKDKALVITALTRVLVGRKLRIGVWVYDAKINDVEYLEGTVVLGAAEEKKWISILSRVIMSQRAHARNVVQSDRKLSGILERAVSQQKSVMERQQTKKEMAHFDRCQKCNTALKNTSPVSCRLCNEVCCANCAPLRQLPTEYDDDNFLGYAARKKLKNICNVCTYILDVLKYDVIQEKAQLHFARQHCSYKYTQMPANFTPPPEEDMSSHFLDARGECSIRSVQRKVDLLKEEVGPKFYVRSDTKSKELGRPVFYEFKDAKAVEEKQEEDQLHEDAAKVATLTSEYDELLEKENQALESQLEQFATKVDGVVKKIVAGEPDLKKRAALEKASREKSRKAKLGWAKAAAAAKKARKDGKATLASVATDVLAKKRELVDQNVKTIVTSISELQKERDAHKRQLKRLTADRDSALRELELAKKKQAQQASGSASDKMVPESQYKAAQAELKKAERKLTTDLKKAETKYEAECRKLRASLRTAEAKLKAEMQKKSSKAKSPKADKETARLQQEATKRQKQLDEEEKRRKAAEEAAKKAEADSSAAKKRLQAQEARIAELENAAKQSAARAENGADSKSALESEKAARQELENKLSELAAEAARLEAAENAAAALNTASKAKLTSLEQQLQQLTDSQARASTAHSAELQQRAEDLQQANAAAQAARDKLAEEILESKREAMQLRHEMADHQQTERNKLRQLETEIAAAQEAKRLAALQNDDLSKGLGQLQQRLDLESDQLRIALLNIEKSKTDARQLESEQAALRAEAGSFKALAKAERDEAVNAERRRGLEREQHYMDEYHDKKRESQELAASQASLKDEHERMKLRLAAARAELEKLQVEELDAATTRALNTATVVVEDSDVKVLQEELEASQEALARQREDAMADAAERDLRSSRIFAEQHRSLDLAKAQHLASMEQAHGENQEMELALQTAREQLKKARSQNSLLVREFGELQETHEQRRDWIRKMGQEEKVLAKTQELNSKAYILQLERSLDETRSQLESAQREARIQEGLDRSRIGRLDDDVAKLQLQLTDTISEKGDLSAELSVESREVTRLRDQLQRADDRSLLIRDTQATLAEESEDMLRRKIKEIGSKLADTKRVSMKVEDSFRQAESEIDILKERIAETEQISKRRLIEELAKLQALARVELDQRMRKEQQTLDRVRQEAAVVEMKHMTEVATLKKRLVEVEAGAMETEKQLLNSAAVNQAQAVDFVKQRAEDVSAYARRAQAEVRALLPPKTTTVLDMHIPEHELRGLNLMDRRPPPLDETHPAHFSSAPAINSSPPGIAESRDVSREVSPIQSRSSPVTTVYRDRVPYPTPQPKQYVARPASALVAVGSNNSPPQRKQRRDPHTDPRRHGIVRPGHGQGDVSPNSRTSPVAHSPTAERSSDDRASPKADLASANAALQTEQVGSLMLRGEAEHHDAELLSAPGGQTLYVTSPRSRSVSPAIGRRRSDEVPWQGNAAAVPRNQPAVAPALPSATPVFSLGPGQQKPRSPVPRHDGRHDIGSELPASGVRPRMLRGIAGPPHINPSPQKQLSPAAEKQHSLAAPYHATGRLGHPSSRAAQAAYNSESSGSFVRPIATHSEPIASSQAWTQSRLRRESPGFGRRSGNQTPPSHSSHSDQKQKPYTPGSHYVAAVAASRNGTAQRSARPHPHTPTRNDRNSGRGRAESWDEDSTSDEDYDDNNTNSNPFTDSVSSSRAPHAKGFFGLDMEEDSDDSDDGMQSGRHASPKVPSRKLVSPVRPPRNLRDPSSFEAPSRRSLNRESDTYDTNDSDSLSPSQSQWLADNFAENPGIALSSPSSSDDEAAYGRRR